MSEPPLINLLVALGIGLLIGTERERRKGSGPERAVAGVRTFSVAALLGAVCMRLGGGMLLAVVAGAVAALCVVTIYRQPDEDPGLTTEIALLLTLLLGATAVNEPALASGLGVMLAGLLASKTRLHYFVTSVITERELHDALILAAATLVILPLVPDRHLGPFDAINPRSAWMLVVLILLIGALGHVASRLLGPRLGLPAAGLASGFVSSTATIAAMGAKAVRQPELFRGCAAAAMFSSIATFIQLLMVLAVISPVVLRELAIPLAMGGIVAAGYALIYVMPLLQDGLGRGAVDKDVGRAISIPIALSLSAILTLMLVLSAAMEEWLGSKGVILASIVSGLADAHSAAASAASLVASGKMEVTLVVVPILAAVSTNALSKIGAAFFAGGRRYALAIAPGILLSLSAAWLAVLI
jgi:uncharacterized membrane protein (DUF4010 family)